MGNAAIYSLSKQKMPCDLNPFAVFFPIEGLLDGSLGSGGLTGSRFDQSLL